MATAKKLPSGSWRVQILDYIDENGKKIRKSFTAPTKKAAELAAAQYNMLEKVRSTNMTVSQAIDRYITAKEGVLSPSTVRGYRQMQKRYFDSIGTVSIHKLTSDRVQRFISTISQEVSAKTVSNVYGLFLSAVTMYRPDVSFRVSLPKKVKPKKAAPSSEQVQRLFSEADGDLKICIALAAYGSMRRGEICALKYRDVTGCQISVHADMVENGDNKFVYKEIPKTSDSVRTVTVPAEVAALIGTGPGDDFIIQRTPNAVTHAFTRLRNRVGIQICFHDLRHYFASIGAVLGIPDVYLSDFGGWRRGSGVLKDVYQNMIDDEKLRYQDIMTAHFSELLQ